MWLCCVAQPAVERQQKFPNSFWMNIEKRNCFVILLSHNRDVLQPRRMQNAYALSVAGMLERSLVIKYVGNIKSNILSMNFELKNLTL